MVQEKKKDAQAKPRCQDEPEAEAKDLRNEELEESTDETLDNIDKALEEDVFVDDFDAVLDEVEGILEPNAEEFVRNYVQRSGQ